MRIFVLIAAILVLLTVGISFFAFFYIFHRPKRSAKIPDFYIGSPHYLASQAGLARMKENSAEDIYLASRDGLKLHAYLYPAEEKSSKFLLGIHGYRSYARPEYGPYYGFYHDLGYNILLPDDRAHAPSQGKYIGFGVLDRLDCTDWANYLVNRFGDGIEILLHGVSMGSATVLAASGEENLPGQVTGIVADCGYTSAWDELSYQFQHTAHLPVYPFLPICEKICKRLAGFDFHKYSPVEQVKKASAPILFIHGSQDRMVPASMAHVLYDACSSRKKLLIIENAGHGASVTTAPERYFKTIREFFDI